jgi:hypothetical protein
MAIRDKTAAFLSQMGANVSPALAQVGGRAAQAGASAMGQVSNQLANMGAPVSAVTGLQSGGAALNAMGQTGQAVLGASLLGAGALGLGAAGAAVARGNRKRKERLAGKELGAQLGVQMPIVY